MPTPRKPDTDQQVTRMPNGVMDYLEHGVDPTEVQLADALATAGDPDPFEQARARQALRSPVTRSHGRPFMTILAEALGEHDPDQAGGAR